MKDSLKLKGDVVIERRTKDGKVIDREELKNLIVNTGKEYIAKLIGGVETGISGFAYIACGIGETGDSTNVSDTTLKNEVKRQASVNAYVASYKVSFETTFDFGTGENLDITEAGVFDVATETGSIMLDRFVFSAKPVDIDTDLYVKITITVN